MKKNTRHTDESAHQTVTEFIKLQNPSGVIQIGFTDQQVSGRAGLVTFAGFLHWHRFGKRLENWLPHRPRSNYALAPAHIALSFVSGILAGAQKLAQVALLRADPVVAPLLEVLRVPCQSTLSRFFQRFNSAGGNLAAFGAAWRWCLERLSSRPEGYSLDLDSTQLLHEDGGQEGVKVGHTRWGNKPCLHPLLAVLEEAKLVVGFWLRPGNTRSDNNVVAFTLELLNRLPRWIRLRRVRADAGFCVAPWLELLENQGLAYIVVARLLRPVQRLIRAQMQWESTEVAGLEVADLWHQELGWKTARRLVVIRRRVQSGRAGGKSLIDCPGYVFQALVTNLPPCVPALGVWRDYNGRAGAENVIKELDAHFALPHLCLEKFWSTEAALSLAVLAYNLAILFQRHLGWLDRVSAGTLKFRLFQTGGILSRTGGVLTLRLAVPPAQRAWWRGLLEKVGSLWSNCNAVESLVT
jgi:Transposase DDE domain group 1